MRHLTWLTLIAFAVACNKDETDTTDSDSGDTDTQPTVTQSLDSGTTSYQLKVDNTTVCNSTYSITGEELEAAFCEDCDFVFSVEATETANSDTTGCTDRNPWRYTLSVPYPAAYPDDRAGIAFASSRWYYAGYLDIPVTDLFFSFYHYNGQMYGYTLMAGTLYPGTADEVALPGTATNDNGDVAWSYGPDAFNSVTGSMIRNCSDRTDINNGNYLGAVATVAAADAGNVITNTDTPTTVSGAVNCEKGAYADSYTVTLASAGDLKVTVDVPTAANAMDGYLFINDASGCTVGVADDSFPCAAGKCTGGDTDATNDYDCCPSVKLTAAPAGTYTIFVLGHPTGGGSCADTTNHMGNYDLKVVGGTPTLATDNLSPSVELDASGTGTITTTTN